MMVTNKNGKNLLQSFLQLNFIMKEDGIHIENIMDQ